MKGCEKASLLRPGKSTADSDPVDIVADHKLVESKGGMVNVTRGAQQWVAKIGGRSKAYYALSAAQKIAVNAREKEQIIFGENDLVNSACEVTGKKFTGLTVCSSSTRIVKWPMCMSSAGSTTVLAGPHRWQRTAMSELSNTDETRRLARRAEMNKLKPSIVPQAYWDEQMDEWDREHAKMLAAMIKAGQEYDAENPDDPAPPASPGDGRVIPMEEFLAEHGFPLLGPVTPVPEA